MDVKQLRKNLKDFLGGERYRRFLEQLSYDQRMRFWQEVAWHRFVLIHPEWNMSESELREALLVCWVHESDLIHETVKVIDPGQLPEVFFITGGYCLPTKASSGENPRFIRFDGHFRSTKHYPCARSVEWRLRSEDCPYPPSVVDVWFCSQCRQGYETEHDSPTPSIDWYFVKNWREEFQKMDAISDDSP